MTKVSKESANHVIGRIAGVKENDSKVEAALKAIAIAKSAGLSTRKMEKMLADYRAKTGE